MNCLYDMTLAKHCYEDTSNCGSVMVLLLCVLAARVPTTTSWSCDNHHLLNTQFYQIVTSCILYASELRHQLRNVFTAQCVCIARTMLSQESVCLSVRHMPVLNLNSYTYLQNFFIVW